MYSRQIEYRKGPTIVRTRLSVAVAAFVLQATQGPWPGAVGHTINYLKAQGAVDLALQVLVLIPEEFSSITFTAISKVGRYPICTSGKISRYVVFYQT